MREHYFLRIGNEESLIRQIKDGREIVFKSLFQVDIDSRYVNYNTVKTNFVIEKEPQKIPNGPLYTVSLYYSDRVLFGDFEAAEMLLRRLVKKLKPNWWSSTHTFVIQMDFIPKGGISQVELRALSDSAEHVGARQVFILKDTSAISENSVQEFLDEIKENGKIKKKNENRFKDLLH